MPNPLLHNSFDNIINKDRVRLFVDRLRSGEFKQGKGYLTTIDKVSGEVTHCCLAVAIIVAEENGVNITSFVDDEYDSNVSLVRYSDADTDDPSEIYHMLPSVRDFYGFNMLNPAIMSKSATLTALNDHHGKDFNEIASLIEEEYLNAPQLSSHE